MNASQNPSLDQRIGVSTLWMPSTGVTFWEAIDKAYEEGFGSIEIIPADFHGIAGYPRTVMSVGFNLDTITDKELDRLAESVSRFSFRHVHGHCRGINIASRNPGAAAESRRQYMQCAELAVKINAKLLTFHMGIPEPQEEIYYDDFIIEKNIEFGKEIAEFAEEHEITAGYENLGGFPSPEQMKIMLDGIGSKRFGFQFDVGHSFMVAPHDPFAWLKLIGDRIVGFHLHGTYHRPDRGYENHQSLELESCIDIAKLKSQVDEHGFSGPITLELFSHSLEDYFAKCKRSKNIYMEA